MSTLSELLSAMHQAVDEMASREGFHGYGPEQGYEFLRKAIAENDYRAHGLEVAAWVHHGRRPPAPSPTTPNP